MPVNKPANETKEKLFENFGLIGTSKAQQNFKIKRFAYSRNFMMKTKYFVVLQATPVVNACCGRAQICCLF